MNTAWQCWLAALTTSSAKHPHPGLPKGTLRGYPYIGAFGMTCRMVSSRSVRYFSWWKVQFMTITKLRRRITSLAAVAALGFGVVSCAAQDQNAADAPQTDMDGVAVAAGANQPDEVNEVDLHFVAMMTPHHQQAVDMSKIILAADGTSTATDDLADRIKVGQQQEIDTMVGWAEAWEQHDLMAQHAPHIANGMITPEQMDQLDSLDGDEADTRFLQLMHFHHEGAIAMTQGQIDNGSYQPLVELAQQMVDIQTAEMHEMEQLLETKGEGLLTD